MFLPTDITKAIIDTANVTGGNLDFGVDVSTWDPTDITTMIDDVVNASQSEKWNLKGVRVSADVLIKVWGGANGFLNGTWYSGVPVALGVADFEKVELVFKP